MTNSDRSAAGRFFSGLWRFIDNTRKVVLNLIFFGLLFLAVMVLVQSGEPLILQPSTALVISPYGNVVEQYSGTPLDLALEQATEEIRQETRLRDLVTAIRRAQSDDRIVRLVIDPTYMSSIGLASLLEIEAAIADFKTSGKPVVAITDNMGQSQYYLAAMADEIWLHPEAMVWIDGFSAYRNFYREGLEKLEVEINLFRVGEFKSAVEPFIRDDMSPEDREANLFWIGSLWQQYLEAVSSQRGIPLVDLSAAVNGFADRLEAANGDFARLALELGLVDRLVSRPEANQELAALGAPAAHGQGFRQVDFDSYLFLTEPPLGSDGTSKVQVVVAEGEIVSGYQPAGVIGTESITEQLRAVGEDADVRAVVFRINSPGGESFASEKIRRELQALREGGRTVVISMGDVAASGAYWIAMAGEEVWASPASITGSIGVFGIFPTFSRPLEKLGIRTDGIGTTPLAGKTRLDMPLDEDLKRIFQGAAEQTYRKFIDVVATSRNMEAAEVEKVARGRVWSGIQAKERGLVDQTGTLQQAIDAAARIAGLGSDYEIEYSEFKVGPIERFLLEMTAGTAAKLGVKTSTPAWRTNSLFEDLLGDLKMLASASEGFTLAAHCLCRAP